MPVATAALTAMKKRKRVEDPVARAERLASRRTRTRFQWLADILQQRRVKRAYDNTYVQWGIAGLIMGNFATNIVEKQIDPWNLRFPDEWKLIEKVWNCIFIVELAWNIYGSFYLSTWKRHFLCSGWNLFDTLVVGISVPTLTGADLGSFSNMRMLRAFRVFRLFKRIPSLNKIITSLGRAVPGIVNAALVQFLVMCIYSILAVDLFGHFGGDYGYQNINNDNVTLVTAREMTFGEEYYGNFFRSLYTLFQVLTGESWSEAVARPTMFANGNSPLDIPFPVVSAFFYVSYIIVCGIVLVNVAVAVLLEKMVEEEPHVDETVITLKDLPEYARGMLSPLDANADGTLDKEELMRAAELLRNARKSESEPAAGLGADAVEKLAEVTREAVRTCVHSEMERTLKDLQLLREEAASREARLLEALSQAAQRESVLQDSLQALSMSMETLSAHANRTRRKVAPGARVGPNGKGPVVAVAAAEEDKVQDGERQASKQAPDRVQQRV